MRKLLCIKKEPTEPAFIGQIGPEREDMEKFLGGPVEKVMVASDLAIFFNAEGEERRLPKCCTIGGMCFRGPLFIAAWWKDRPAAIPATKVMDVMRRFFGEEEKRKC